jgi:hypothetical protein
MIIIYIFIKFFYNITSTWIKSYALIYLNHVAFFNLFKGTNMLTQLYNHIKKLIEIFCSLHFNFITSVDQESSPNFVSFCFKKEYEKCVSCNRVTSNINI